MAYIFYIRLCSYVSSVSISPLYSVILESFSDNLTVRAIVGRGGSRTVVGVLARIIVYAVLVMATIVYRSIATLGVEDKVA